MTLKIFRNAFHVGLAVLALCLVLFVVVLQEYYETRVYEDMEAQAGYVAQAVEQLGGAYFDGLTLRDRVTWVAADGAVLYDSAADAGAMENHLDRQEIADALATGTGQSAHFSQTLLEKTLYYALRLEDGTVVRIACRQSSAAALVLSMAQPLLWVIVLSLLIAGLLASNLAHKITRPLNELNLDEPVLPDHYSELRPLLQRLREQKRTIHRQMDELSRRQREFEAITGNMSEGFLMFNHHGAILSGNKSGRAMYERESAAVRRCATAARAGESVRESVELDGRCYAIVADPVVTAGQVSGAVVMIMDETERELRERLRREFSANVSHELKTPLTSISGFAELMKAGIVPPEKVKEFAGDIYNESRRLITLVDDIIRISRLDESSALPERERVELRGLCAGVLERLQPVAQQRSVTLTLAGDTAELNAMRQILDEMVYNLCDNAIKYNRPGGSVTVTVANGDKTVTLTVADTGIGIPLADQPRVFERFYRVDKSHSKAIGGTGLGLSIVKHGAQYHDARLTLESAEGQGTTIRLIFNKETL